MSGFSDPFRHGVASGDPLPDGVVLWTRVTPVEEGAVEVAWRVASDPGLEEAVVGGTAVADASTDYTVHVDPRGLEPATTYLHETV